MSINIWYVCVCWHTTYKFMQCYTISIPSKRSFSSLIFWSRLIALCTCVCPGGHAQAASWVRDTSVVVCSFWMTSTNSNTLHSSGFVGEESCCSEWDQLLLFLAIFRHEEVLPWCSLGPITIKVIIIPKFRYKRRCWVLRFRESDVLSWLRDGSFAAISSLSNLVARAWSSSW